MSEFIKGQWEADEDGEYVFVRTPFNLEMVAQIRGWSYLTGTGEAELNLSAEEAIEVQKANARLIATAPEMYDELYEVLQLLKGKSSYDGDEFDQQAKSIQELFARIDGKAAKDE